MDFGSNSVLERVAFGLKCVLHRVGMSQCCPSRVIKNTAEQPPPGKRKHIILQNGFLQIALELLKYYSA